MRFVGGNFSSDPTADISGISSVDSDIDMTPFSAATEAYAEEAWETGPSSSVVDWLGNKLTGAQMPESGVRMTNKLTDEELEDRKANEFYGKYIKVPKEGFTDWEYDNALTETRKRMMRQSTMARAPAGFAQGAKRLGVELAVGIADPTNVVGALLPRGAFIIAGKTALIETKAMQNLTKSVDNYAQALDDMSAIQRMGSRAKLGAAESVPGAALVEVPIYAGAHLRGEDYTMEDVFMSIGLGIIIDTGIHVGAGGLFDVVDIPTRKLRNEKIKSIRASKAADEIEAYADIEKELTIFKLQEENSTALQRFQSNLSEADRSAVLQTGLAQMVNDSNTNMQGLLDTIESKILTQKGTDPGTVMAGVVKEMNARESHLLGVSPPKDGDYDKAYAKLAKEVDKLEGELTGRIPSDRSRAGQTGQVRADLGNRLPRLARMLDAELQGKVPTTRSKKGATNKIRAELDAVLARMSKLDIDFVGSKFDNPITAKAKIDAEFDRRMNLIRGGEEGAKVNQIHEMLAGLKKTAEAPESQRTYRQGAEASQKKTGAKQTDEQANSVLTEQAADAEENANMAAEASGTEYQTDAETDAVISTIDDTAAEVEKFKTCMSGSI